MKITKTNRRAYAGGAYLAPLSEAEARWLSDAMIEGPVLEECNTWIVRYQSGKPSEVMIEASGKAWVDPALALPACADLVRRFLAQWRPAEEVVFNWACWTHGDYVPRRPDQSGGGRVRITADQIDWHALTCGQPTLPEASNGRQG